MIKTIIFIITIVMISSFGFGAEVNDGVTYYGNKDLPAEKTRSTVSQPQKTIPSSGSPADAVVAEVNGGLCPKGQARYSDNDSRRSIERLEWLKTYGLSSEQNAQKKLMASRVIDSCIQIWKINMGQNESERTTNELLRQIQEKANRGR